MKTLKLAFVLSLAIACFCPDAAAQQWVKQTVDTKASLRGLSVASDKVVWASGTGGTIIKTTDGGTTWKVMTVSGAEKLDFRDIEAFDANTAYILSIGNGEVSRIYKTTDGGTTWKLQFQNKNEKAFYDALACWSRTNCIAMSDPVDGKFQLLRTTNGNSWEGPHGLVADDKGRHAIAVEGEAAFAASGTCLVSVGKHRLFLVSGGSAARVYRSWNRGESWSVSGTPMTKGTPGSGIFSVAFRNELHGTIVGGNYEEPDEAKGNLAFTRDGGKTWYAGEGLSGYRSAVTYIDDRTMIAVGTNGTDISYDRGGTWKKIGNEDLNTVAAKGKNAVWAVGPNGGVFRLDERSADTSRNGDSRRKGVASGLPANVTALRLSHTEISPTCPSSNTDCSGDRQIEVTVTAVQPDDAEYVYKVSAGRIIGNGPNVRWVLSEVTPGTYTITAGISVPVWGALGLTKTAMVVIR
jgi:photosystem II stability/assembly factor-like uncharacterized protein